MTVVLLVVCAALLGPVLVKPIERNLELFFLAVGMLTALVRGQFDAALVSAALREPAPLALAVLAFGIVFGYLRAYLDRLFARMSAVVEPRWMCFGLTIVLGALAGFITAVVASLVLVEAISYLRLDRRSETAAVVLACFAIGLGAGLTPLGMPASTIVLAALHEDFWYLARLLGPFIFGAIVLVATVSLWLSNRASGPPHPMRERETWMLVLMRAGRVYAFVAGLVGLSRGLRPLIETYIERFPEALLFWLNSISAVVDNATLAAVEIGPSISRPHQRAVMMALLISGGMLIPGNIPNIVAAGRLRITSSEWARVGLLVGLPLMLLGFIVLKLID